MATIKRTYGGRRVAGGTTLDYRELLQSVDNTSTVFDALSIKNLKQLKKNTTTSFATWSNQSQRSSRLNRKKLVKRANQKEEAPKRPDPSEAAQAVESCLTPDKSFRVNRTPDPFDLLCAQSPQPLRSRNNDIFDQLACSNDSDGVWSCRDEIRNHPQINITPDESDYCIDSTNKENQDSSGHHKNDSKSYPDGTLHSSDMNKYTLKIELAAEKKEERLSDSIKSVVNNVTFLRELVKHNSSGRKKWSKKSNSPVQQNGLLTSTPYRIRHNKKYSMNISPINLRKSKLPFISLISASPLQPKSSSVFDRYSDVQDSKTHTSNKLNCSNGDTHNESPRKSIFIEKELQVTNKTDGFSKSKMDSECHLSGEPFLGFTNVPETLDFMPRDYSVVLCNSFDDVENKKGKERKISHKFENNTCESDRFQKSISESQSELSSESFESSDSYETCSSEDKYENPLLLNIDNHKIQPFVRLVRMNDSLFNKYCNMESHEESNTSVTEVQASMDLSNNENNLRHSINCDVNGRNTIAGHDSQDNLDIDKHENRESINISSDSDYTDIDSDSQSCYSNTSSRTSTTSTESSRSSKQKSESGNELEKQDDKIQSFITTRRGNDFMDDSVMILLDDSDESGPDKDITVITCDKEANIENNIEERKVPSELYKLNKMKTEDDEVNTICSKSIDNPSMSFLNTNQDFMLKSPVRPSIVLLPGKKWERSLSIYRRQTMQPNQSPDNDIEDSRESLHDCAGDNFRGSPYLNDSACERRNKTRQNPRRSTLKIVKEVCTGRSSISILPVVEDDIGFLSEDCDDTLCELSRLSLSSSLDVTVIEKGPREATARDVLLRRCNQTEPLPFHECYPDSVLKNCRKIGEGVYGEVFLYRGQDGRARVMKIVPVQGCVLVNGEHQKTYQEIISEVVIAMELSALRGPIADIEKQCDEDGEVKDLDLHMVENATETFNEVLAVRLVYGPYPARLLDLWELYDESHGSENDSPLALPADQQYVALELKHAGCDLEGYQFNSAEQAHALFYQIAYALAVAEEAYQFEHRDLHWGNVLIKPTDQKFARFVLRGRLHSVACRGVSATIIDYTLSRVSLPLAGGERAVLYNDLATEEGLFHSAGDYQFEVYRCMRDKTKNDWKSFEPYTNILWLHYTVDKMITALRYKRTNTKIHKSYIAKLKGIKNRLLDYGSAVEFVLTDEH